MDLDVLDLEDMEYYLFNNYIDFDLYCYEEFLDESNLDIFERTAQIDFFIDHIDLEYIHY